MVISVFNPGLFDCVGIAATLRPETDDTQNCESSRASAIEGYRKFKYPPPPPALPLNYFQTATVTVAPMLSGRRDLRRDERADLQRGRTHPVLERAEHMFDGTASYRHDVELAVQPLLHRLKHPIVLPPPGWPSATSI